MKSNPLIVLVYPRTGADAKNVSLHPPLSLLYLAAELHDSYRIEIYDERTDDPDRLFRLLDENPLCVGFSIFTGPQIKHALVLAEKVKDRHITTVFGGIHATILPEQTASDPKVDYVVTGDGEYAFRSLLFALQNNEPNDPVINGDHHPPVDLNNIAPLPYDLIQVENYIHTASLPGRSLPFLFSRGCPYRCTFCCNPAISNGQWRTMNVEVALDRLNVLVEKYQLDSVFFLDENLTVNPQILNELVAKIDGRFYWGAQTRADALLKNDLKYLEKMGARYFGVGLESGSDRILKQIKKQETVDQFIETNRRLAQTGISVWYNYITGFPGETHDDLHATLELALTVLDENPHARNNTFYLLTPYPGTEIGKTLSNYMPQTLDGWSEFGRHNYNAPWYAPQQVKLYQRIGFSSKFTGRRLTSLFPEDAELADFARIVTEKWRCFDLLDDDQWEILTQKGWQILRKHFGEHAY
ncbi:MAG: B12-binding domain-containing radical SAM protein [Planctomycetes bacterium]|nr:B12-binding domain-containing radical SAM protein [Planctomycetota bacterium]